MWNNPRLAPIVLVAVLALGLAACGASPELTATPSSTPSPVSTRTAAPTSTPADPAAAATCTTALDAASIDEFAANDYELSDDFAQRAIDEQWPEAAFVTAGGLLCQWGFPNSDASEYYGIAELGTDEASALSARLVADGYTPEPYADGQLLVGPVTEGIRIHYFTVGESWLTAFSPKRIDELRRNAGLV